MTRPLDEPTVRVSVGPRIRSVKPTIWQSEQIGRVPIAARLLFVGLITQADDYGRLRGAPSLIKATVFPYDESLSTRRVIDWLDALVAAGLIRRYTAGGSQYIDLPTWGSHQTINRRADRSMHPSYDERDDAAPSPTSPGDPSPSTAPRSQDTDSLSAHASLSERSRPEGKGKGKQQQRARESAAPSPPTPAEPAAAALSLRDRVLAERPTDVDRQARVVLDAVGANPDDSALRQLVAQALMDALDRTVLLAERAISQAKNPPGYLRDVLRRGVHLELPPPPTPDEEAQRAADAAAIADLELVRRARLSRRPA